MLFTVVDESTAEIEFECADSLAFRWTCGAILEGRTYPHLPFIGPLEAVDLLAATNRVQATAAAEGGVIDLRHQPVDSLSPSVSPGCLRDRWGRARRGAGR